MKARDIVIQIASVFPQYSDAITSEIGVSSLSRSGATVTVVTDSAHGLSVNKGVCISGALTPLAISSLARSGTVGTLETSLYHDITLGSQPTVTISGATEPEFNGTFSITGVENRKKITFLMEDSGPTVATGSPILENGASIYQSYNGLRKVTATPTTTSFQYEVSDSTLGTPALGSIIARTDPRVSAAVSIDRANASYTKYSPNEVWLFVVLGDVFASKDRNNLSDATSNTQGGNYFRQQIIQTVNIYAFIPTGKNEIAGRKARDDSEDIFHALCKSILFEKFDSGLSSGKQNRLQFVGHGTEYYDSSYYVHRYSFEQVADILFQDTAGFGPHVALRDIALSMTPDFGTESLIANIDLDDEPLP